MLYLVMPYKHPCYTIQFHNLNCKFGDTGVKPLQKR